MSPPALNQRWVAFAVALAALGLLLYLLAPILTPFALGAGLAYLGDPLVDRLQRWGLSRTAGVSVVFIVIFAAILSICLLLIPQLEQQIVAFLGSLPDWLRWLEDVGLPKLGLKLPEGTRLDADSLKQAVSEHWSGFSGVAGAAWQRISASGAALLTAAVNLLLVPVVSFYLLRDWDEMIARIGRLIPRGWLPKVSHLARETDDVLAAFIRGQLSVMAAMAVFYSIALSIAGLKLGLLIGLLAGLVTFVPYLGFITGILTAGIAMLVQTHELLPLVWIGAIFGVGQVLEAMVLTPWLVGSHIGLHPVAVLFAVLAGGELFGFAGVLLALPAASVLSVLVRHALERWQRSALYREEVPPPLTGAEAAPPGDVPAAPELPKRDA